MRTFGTGKESGGARMVWRGGWLMRVSGVLLLAGVLGLVGMGEVRGQERGRVVFYNVENLFDTSDDPLTEDEEFTPQGMRHWTRGRYVEKLRRLAEVVDSVGGGELPLLVGLAEVENWWVLRDLTERTALARGGYGVVHRDSPDTRGIDVALLYRQACMEVVAEEFLPVLLEGEATREVLYVKGVLGGLSAAESHDTLHCFVCHFPSMRGGERQSEWKRIRAAKVVRTKVDSLFAADKDAAIIVMGDLNGKANTTAQRILCPEGGVRLHRSGELYNPGYYLLREPSGSYRYQGRWQTIDHIIVSGSLLNGTFPWQASPRTEIYSAPFLLEEDKTHFGFKPFPTYRGPRYAGGYSDHLPVYIVLGKKAVDRAVKK